MRPVAFIDLFSGMGGFTTGAINAGATCILSVDSWAEANLVHLANHPDAPYKTMELGHPSHWKMFKRLVDFYKELGYHVHIHGSPPCQALSNASRRDAEEGMPLVLWYLDLVERCEPDSWSMENVVPVRKRLPEGTPAVILNSADFGVPQTRKRCFAGSGWEARPTHMKDEWVSVLDALPHLEGELVGFSKPPSMEKHWAERGVDEPFPTITSQSRSQFKLLMDSGRASAPTSGVNPRTGKKEGGSGPLFRTLSEPSYTILSSPRRILKLEALGANANRSRDTKLSEPSKTICGSGNQVGPRLFDHDSDKPQKVRSLTMPETLVLQGFPADYDMSAARTQKARWTMIGNAVPPPVAEAVIRGIHHGIHN
jgi:site-specific DNA-cytosine methylase